MIIKFSSKILIIFILLTFFSKGWTSVSTPSLDVVLDNGLRLVVYEDRRAPTVLQMTLVKAGSIDEVDGLSGVAHVLEHMMFKRTKNMSEGEFSRRINILGGRENAFTSKEFTGYHQQVHKNSLEEIIKLEADRMQNLIIEKNDFEKEIQVVLQERLLRTDDNPKSLAYETLFAQAFHSSPIRRPIIGWRDDIINLTVEDAKLWYDTWYVPNNLTVIIAGDVDSVVVLEWVKKYYGNAQRKALPLRKPRLEPSQTGQRRIEVKAPAENKFILKLWKAPVISSDSGPLEYSNQIAKDVVAMGVLSIILGNTDTGVLIKKLVRDSQKALSINVGSSWMSRGPGYFAIDATPASGVNLQELESEIVYEIKQVLRSGFESTALERIKIKARADEIYMKDSLMSQVREAGTLINVGRPLSDSDSWLSILEEITFEDIAKVGSKIFNENQETVIEFTPLSTTYN